MEDDGNLTDELKTEVVKGIKRIRSHSNLITETNMMTEDNEYYYNKFIYDKVMTTKV